MGPQRYQKLNQGNARCRRAFAKQGVRPWKDTHRVKYSQPKGAGPRCPECLLHQSFHAQATCSRSLKYTGEEFYGSTTPQPIATKSSKITIIKGRPSRTREACYSSTRTQEGTCRPTFFHIAIFTLHRFDPSTKFGKMTTARQRILRQPHQQ